MTPSTLNELPTPALLVDVERLERNIDAMARHLESAGVRLRPHVKTSKCWDVAGRQLAAGAVGFTCSTAAEVAWLRGHGVTDLLWAQQPVGPAKVDFVVSTSRDSGPLLVALDSVEAARPLAARAEQAEVEVPYLIEVDSGHHRAGVDPDRVVERARALAGLDGLLLRGIMTHEGHLSRYARDRAALERAGREAGTMMAGLADRLRLDGHDISVVSVGSTPGASSVPLCPGVTEARPGTYVYYDANQVRLGGAVLEQCALTVLGRVISVERSGVAIIDAGIKAMSSDTIATAGSVGVVCDPGGAPIEDAVFAEANEEHGFLTGGHRFAVGDLVRVVPNHACGTANMFAGLHAVRAGRPVGRWPVSARHGAEELWAR